MIPMSHKRDFGVILEPHGSSLSIFRKYENLPPDDVSVQQMIIKNAISLCWRTMLLCSDIHVIQNMVRSTLLQVAGGRQTAQVPKCELLIFT